MSLQHEWTVKELLKRVRVQQDPLANMPPNSVMLSTGVGTFVKPTSIPIIGDWVTKSVDFEFNLSENYLINTELNTVAGILPLAPFDKMTILIKDVKSSFGTNSFFLIRHPDATYTIQGLNEDLEVDAPITTLFLVYDIISNNWII